MFDCGCHDNDTSDALNMAFFVHSPSKPTTTPKNNGGFKNLFPTLLHCLQESLLIVKMSQMSADVETPRVLSNECWVRLKRSATFIESAEKVESLSNSSRIKFEINQTFSRLP